MIYRGFEIIREVITNTVGNMTVDSDSDSVYFGGRRIEITQPTAGHTFAKHVIDVLVGQGIWPNVDSGGAGMDTSPEDSESMRQICGTCEHASFTPDNYLGSCARGFTVWRNERICQNYENKTKQRRVKK